MTDQVLDIFREEAREHLAALERAFLDMEAAGPGDALKALIDKAFRHAHSLKGDAKVIGVGPLKEAAQQLEDVLDALREKPQNADSAAVGRGLAQFDRVKAALEAWQSGGVPKPAPVEELKAQAPPPPEPADVGFTVRVPSERLDRMLDLAGEVRICHRAGEAVAARLADLRQHLTGMQKTGDRQALAAALDQVRRIEADLRRNRGREELIGEALEADIREARLLPVAMLTDALRRAVRDLAQSLGKPIRYDAPAGHVLLDKAVIEGLREPLLHLIRNAADHGLERPDERRAAGKPEEGTIRIEAEQRGPLVKLRVSDDGRGVNFALVRDRVHRMGQLDEAGVGALSERELTAYLFHPGFSTAARGEVSGRGVGLDVVRESLRRLQGSVEVEATSPAGTTFALTVPVSISTVRILTVLAGGTPYGVPTTAIRRTGRARPADLRDVAGTRVLMLDGRPLRWALLNGLLGLPTAEAKAWSYLLIAVGGQDVAVAVEDLEDEAEVLLKPLGAPLGGLPGIVGATIRANGAVQLVLDLTSPVWTHGDAPRPAARAEPKAGRILVVDDSPTTRAVLRNVFSAAGYAVTTATDGIDALERLKTRLVDLVVSDCEMPRLNGLDLTRQIKSRYGLPVILVTGREKEEHRREGLAAGADAYVVKSSFQGEGLLDIVKQFV